jgi:hypothetical protein
MIDTEDALGMADTMAAGMIELVRGHQEQQLGGLHTAPEG